MRDVLEQVRRGEIEVEQAMLLLAAERVESVADLARLDPDRIRRKGVPEVIYAPGKTPELTAQLAERMLAAGGTALVSRVTPEHDKELARVADGHGVELEAFGLGRRIALHPAKKTGGLVGLLAAGTSDVDAIEEARMLADSMGTETRHAYDVGVSALHRLAEPLAAMVAEDVAVYVVAAGMEGALPSVVAGLVSAPVIGLPTSTGYGVGGAGLAALLAMLQTCSPGVTVVNVDNGVGAGAAAALIAKRQSPGK